jgi:hypothetical protein
MSHSAGDFGCLTLDMRFAGSMSTLELGGGIKEATNGGFFVVFLQLIEG